MPHRHGSWGPPRKWCASMWSLQDKLERTRKGCFNPPLFQERSFREAAKRKRELELQQLWRMPYTHCLICSPQVWGRNIINLIMYPEMGRNQLKFTYMGTAIIQSQVCLMPDFQLCLPNHASVNPSTCKYYFHRAWTQLNMVSSNSFRDTEFPLTQLYLDRPNYYNVINAANTRTHSKEHLPSNCS